MSFFKRLIPVKSDFHLVLEKPVVEQGQPFKGTATMAAKESFKVEEVRLEVRVLEDYQQPEWRRDAQGNQRQEIVKKTEVRFSQNVPVAQGFDASAGDQKQFPVQAMVPMFQSMRPGGNITYSLKAVLAIKGRPDVTSETKPSVMPAMAMPQMAQVTQVIQKEVVKIPCKFCGALVELSSGPSKCPNCGAFVGT